MSIKENIVIDQGANFLVEIAVVDVDGLAIDLTGYTANTFLKREWGSLANTKITVTSSITAEDGIITLSMTHAATANLTPHNYVWACDLTSSSNTKSRVCSGSALVEPSPDWDAP